MEIPWSAHAASFMSAAAYLEHAARWSKQVASLKGAAAYPKHAAQRWLMVIDQSPTCTTSPRYIHTRPTQTYYFTPNLVDPTPLV